ncbi:MAG: hypothetical protein JW781_00930 [Deltaproteobacteria bacterium]|nr:hypothetical protein [Candidatus Anaeroferrophillacea bacterium]
MGTDSARRCREIMARLGVPAADDGLLATLPFTAGDVTAGTETELQAGVVGRRRDVDLPRTIECSNYFANIIRRAGSGDLPRKVITDLERYLEDNPDNLWENSWVRFPRSRLSPAAGAVLEHDLLADKRYPEMGRRGDAQRFLFFPDGREEYLRVPVSYLLKLALAEAVGDVRPASALVRGLGLKLMAHFISDNTSPETTSFYVVSPDAAGGMGADLARENGRRYLLSHLLVLYANRRFGLVDDGQQAEVYLSAHPPVRQQLLNDSITDAFYRELFMSPCLSGWDRGEEKSAYMGLCHRVLSRSQLNGVAKLREAGIINNNLVVLPNVSSTSLANNGTHISIGSRRLSAVLAAGDGAFTPADEKYVGDLVIKVVEHFLPLFVGTYAASPYRLDFEEFHPETVLGFLPHELDYTHLRMFWRRWKKKARLQRLGTVFTPFGPPWLDRTVGTALRLKGDLVPDFRLVDYLVAPLSTEQSPALSGVPGNDERLKNDLADLGVFDRGMSLYALYRLRRHAFMGFSGFEGRHYSLFADLHDDLRRAADLQVLVTACAWKLIARGRVTHDLIPDNPTLESERRQIFFATAVGLPTFFVGRGSRNRFLADVVRRTRQVRASRRYPGYMRVKNTEYRRALIEYLRREAADLVEMYGCGDLLNDLEERVRFPAAHAASHRLVAGVLAEGGVQSPFRLRAREFNTLHERYCRGTLRRGHLDRAWDGLAVDLDGQRHRGAEMRRIIGDRDPGVFVADVRREIDAGRADAATLEKTIHLLIVSLADDLACDDTMPAAAGKDVADDVPSIYRAANG